MRLVQENIGGASQAALVAGCLDLQLRGVELRRSPHEPQLWQFGQGCLMQLAFC
jgi:hypothetical protein